LVVLVNATRLSFATLLMPSWAGGKLDFSRSRPVVYRGNAVVRQFDHNQQIDSAHEERCLNREFVTEFSVRLEELFAVSTQLGRQLT
jgi:hypothetical protein